MGSKLDIPSVYNPADPAALKRDLERFATAVDSYTRNADKLFTPKPGNAPSSTLSFDNVTRVSLLIGDVLTLQLPQPDVKNGGRTLYIKRETAGGTVNINGVGCLINGRSSKVLPNAPGMYSIYFDATNYYSSPQFATGWGG